MWLQRLNGACDMAGRHGGRYRVDMAGGPDVCRVGPYRVCVAMKMTCVRYVTKTSANGQPASSCPARAHSAVTSTKRSFAELSDHAANPRCIAAWISSHVTKSIPRNDCSSTAHTITGLAHHYTGPDCFALLDYRGAADPADGSSRAVWDTGSEEVIAERRVQGPGDSTTEAMRALCVAWLRPHIAESQNRLNACARAIRRHLRCYCGDLRAPPRL